MIERTCVNCGAVFQAPKCRVVKGLARFCSCACSNRGKGTTHGHTIGRKRSPTYVSWNGIIGRCTNPNNAKYYMYGARGVTVCERWLKFENFLADMGERPEGKSIDRIDGSMGYFKENCRWATPKEQSSNTRLNRRIEHDGRTQTLA